MARLTARHGLALGAALIAGAALALPFGSSANTAVPTGTSTGTTTTTKTTVTTPKPPPAPTDYPGGVEHVTTSSAVLKATVNPQGSATEYSFQYGTTAAYGAQTPATAAGAGTTPVKVTATVLGLQPYTAYHFRVVATSAAGTTASADAVFTTAKVPLSFVVSAAPDPVSYGSRLVLSGTLSGTGAAGAEVVVQANPFPYLGGFRDITAGEPTDAAGSFSFPITGLLKNTQLRVSTVATVPPVVSRVVVERVEVHVSLHVRSVRRPGFVRLYGTVTPAAPYSPVALERRLHGRWATVGYTNVKGRRHGVTSFARTIRIRRHGLYRALVHVANGAVVAGHSRPVYIG